MASGPPSIEPKARGKNFGLETEPTSANRRNQGKLYYCDASFWLDGNISEKIVMWMGYRLESVVRRLPALVVFLSVLTVQGTSLGLAASSSPISSILDRCVSCHRGKAAQASLDLSSRRGALEGGSSGPALVPGHATRSLLFQKSSDGKMPPGAPLSAAEIVALRLWIDEGAAWPDLKTDLPAQEAASEEPTWWSLRPLGPAKVPDVAHASWIRRPLDAFVLWGLENQGLEASGEADKVTLIRRATLDLLGLPPTPEEIDDFVGDASPRAYEELLDRLLASLHYGERWGRHWLDLARFGESHGYERDQIRDNAWPYRDYVISSFNQDKPYPRFVREQLAGDVLEPVTREGIAGTGFLVAAPWDDVGHAQQSRIMRARVRADEMEDIVGTVAQTFLGLTVNCARCHDHKFDPILQKDYYRLKAALDGVWHGDRTLLEAAEVEERRRLVKPLQRRIRELSSEVAALHESARQRILKRKAYPMLAQVPGLLSRWAFDADAYDQLGGLHGNPDSDAVIDDGGLQFKQERARFTTMPLQQDLREKTLEIWLRMEDHAGYGFYMTVLGEGPTSRGVFDGLRYDGGSRTWKSESEYNNRTLQVEKAHEAEGLAKPLHLAIVYGPQDRISIYREGKLYAGYGPQREGPETKLQVFRAGKDRVRFGRLEGGGRIDEARLYGRALTAEEVQRSYRGGIHNVTRSEVLEELSDEEGRQKDSLLEELVRRQADLERVPPIPLAYAANSLQPGPTFVQNRGDPAAPGERVLSGGLSGVSTLSPEFGLAENAPEAQRRLRLAEWILDPDNPLTSRVLVNRVWQYHFGRGIVGTPNDFGFNGERPSHPELLDWLARWFIDHGWSLKALHKEIMLSSSYRQSSRFREAAADRDPENRLLWRYSPRRLEAEVIRDALLATSGELNWKRGGPGFRPFEVRIFNTHFYDLKDLDEAEMKRRSVYRIVVRSAGDPLLESFDCPDSAFKAPRRGITTTPLQSLVLMNNSFVLRQADRLAQRIEGEAVGVLPIQVDRAYRLTLGRIPRGEEASRALAHIQRHGLESLCWALFNSSEFLYLN